MDTETPQSYHAGDTVRVKSTGQIAIILYFDATDQTYTLNLPSEYYGGSRYYEDDIEPYSNPRRITPKVPINNLAEYAARMDANPQPTDQFCVTIDRAARDWFVSDLTKRKKRLMQAVSDPKIKSAKGAKRQKELRTLIVTLNSLQDAEKKVMKPQNAPNYFSYHQNQRTNDRLHNKALH